jgi:hypothetical protein
MPASPPPDTGRTDRLAPERRTARAQHGYRNEVSWSSGAGRQPYPNQDADTPDDPAPAGECREGNRGIHSGVTLAQMRALRGTP